MAHYIAHVDRVLGGHAFPQIHSHSSLPNQPYEFIVLFISFNIPKICPIDRISNFTFISSLAFELDLREVFRTNKSFPFFIV